MRKVQRFERRLEGLVEGAFAKVFGGVVQPVEVAAALQREAADKRMIVGHGRELVPNDYVVELGSSDAERLQAYDAPLRREFAAMVTEHATEQGWSFVGPVEVRLETADDLDTGVFRVRSAVVPGSTPGPAASPTAAPAAGGRSDGVLVVTEGGSERTVPLTGRPLRIGRGAEADLRLADTGVSRLHAEVRPSDDGAGTVITDLGSTNGTTVNGHRVSTAELHDGDRVVVGTTSLVLRAGG